MYSVYVTERPGRKTDLRGGPAVLRARSTSMDTESNGVTVPLEGSSRMPRSCEPKSCSDGGRSSDGGLEPPDCPDARAGGSGGGGGGKTGPVAGAMIGAAGPWSCSLRGFRWSCREKMCDGSAGSSEAGCDAARDVTAEASLDASIMPDGAALGVSDAGTSEAGVGTAGAGACNAGAGAGNAARASAGG